MIHNAHTSNSPNFEQKLTVNLQAILQISLVFNQHLVHRIVLPGSRPIIRLYSLPFSLLEVPQQSAQFFVHLVSIHCQDTNHVLLVLLDHTPLSLDLTAVTTVHLTAFLRVVQIIAYVLLETTLIILAVNKI